MTNPINNSHPFDNPNVITVMEHASTSGRWVISTAWIDTETNQIKCTAVSNQFPNLDMNKTKAMMARTVGDLEIVKEEAGMPMFNPQDPNNLHPPAAQ